MIPVAFCIDKSYVLQTFVVMHSILKNSKERFHFIILTKDEILESVEELKKILADRYDNFMVDIRRIDAETFCNVKIHNRHLSQASYFRLLIPELIQEYDKCLYLDSDILVNGNLREIFETELGEDYLAGVRDCHLSRKSGDFLVTKHQIRMNLPSVENYINAGVLLMNLKRLRCDKMADRFLEQAEKENPYEDQDVINICCYGRIRILPLKYNVFHHYTGNTIKHLFGGTYTKQDFIFDWNIPCILHMAEKYKPWMNKKYKGADIWWKTAEIYKDCACYRKAYHHCKEAQDDIRDMVRIFEVCNKKKRIILWGFTEQGRDVCDVFLGRGILIDAFCDSDVKKHGEKYKNIPVLNVESMLESDEDTMWIITCKNAYPEVYRQLTGLGVKAEDMIHFTYNSRNWKDYLVLASKYYAEEIKMIALCENAGGKVKDDQYLAKLCDTIEKADIKDEFYRYLYSKYRFDLWLKC